MVYGIFGAVTVVCMYDRDGREALVFNVDYVGSRICDSTNFSMFWEVGVNLANVGIGDVKEKA